MDIISKLKKTYENFINIKVDECFGCPPSGDGKNRDGSDDRRCRKKGEGDTGAIGGIAKGKSAPKIGSPKSGERSPAERISSPTFQDPPTLKDKQDMDLQYSKKKLEDAKKSGNASQIRSAQSGLDDMQNRVNPSHPTYQYQLKDINKTYNNLVEKETGVSGATDFTWNYKTGEPTKKPKPNSKRKVYKERRSSDDIREGYPEYKVHINWD